LQDIDIYNKLTTIFPRDVILSGVSMKDYTTMKVGGKADYMVLADSIENIQKCVSHLSSLNVPFLIMGNGSNLVFTDNGYHGVIIRIGPAISKTEVDGEIITAEAGALLSSVANLAMENSLTGLEFAFGIPGTIGGAAYMNAGAYDGEMKQVIIESLCIDKEGRYITLRGDEHNFSYRHSRMQDEDLICLKVKLKLNRGNKEEIKAKMAELSARRREKQPLTYPSAGSIFKRPSGAFAGKLIDDCGLRGYRIGGAQVSDKHCGFIINTGNATASDVLALIKHVQETVYKNFGKLLELEVKIIGG